MLGQGGNTSRQRTSKLTLAVGDLDRRKQFRNPLIEPGWQAQTVRPQNKMGILMSRYAEIICVRHGHHYVVAISRTAIVGISRRAEFETVVFSLGAESDHPERWSFLRRRPTLDHIVPVEKGPELLKPCQGGPSTIRSGLRIDFKVWASGHEPLGTCAGAGKTAKRPRRNQKSNLPHYHSDADHTKLGGNEIGCLFWILLSSSW